MPHCPAFERCGGCPLLPLSGDAQRERKLARVRSLRAMAELDIQWVSTTREQYRRRIRMRVDEAGHPTFFNADKDRDCVVLTAGLRAAVARVRDLTLRGATHVEVREPDLDGRPGLYVAGPTPEVEGFVVGDGWQRFAITEDVWSYVPLNAFLQVHAATNQALVEALVHGASRRRCRSFFDAFAGAGNHALALASVGLVGHAADRDDRAIRALRAAAFEQGWALTSQVGDACTTAGTLPQADLLICNPPRAGVRQAAAPLAALRAPHIALVTCTPEAFAFDATAFEGHGYRLDEVVAFDMFPHTEHVELLAWLHLR